MPLLLLPPLSTASVATAVLLQQLLLLPPPMLPLTPPLLLLLPPLFYCHCCCCCRRHRRRCCIYLCRSLDAVPTRHSTARRLSLSTACSAMTDEEKKDLQLFDAEARTRVAQQVGAGTLCAGLCGRSRLGACRSARSKAPGCSGCEGSQPASQFQPVGSGR